MFMLALKIQDILIIANNETIPTKNRPRGVNVLVYAQSLDTRPKRPGYETSIDMHAYHILVPVKYVCCVCIIGVCYIYVVVYTSN